MVTYENRLSVTPDAKPLHIKLSQNNKDYTLVFNLYSLVGTFTMESGSTATLQGRRPDPDRSEFSVGASISGTTITVTGISGILNVPGQAVCEIVIQKNNKRLSTSNFYLDIEPKA